MATLTTNNGRRIVQVYVRDRRRTISVGRVSHDDARTIKGHVERLARAVDWHIPASAETLKWLNGISERLHRRLADLGLCDLRVPVGSLQLKRYVDAYLARRTDLKGGSRTNLEQVRNFAADYFGAARELATISRGDVKDWRRALAERYAEATVATHVKRMRQVFADAVDRRLIPENPFKSVRGGSQSNPGRMHYVSKDDIAKVIDACPDWEWRLLFALARYGGLRVPSETRALRWIDIDFIKNRFVVHSSKTEHHAGKATRVVPIFPELLPRILEAQAQSDSGTDYVFDRLRHVTLFRPAHEIIARAGLKVWEKVFQNLRSSCETDLASAHPMHVACAWIGNSTGVALKHYLQVTDADYERAAKALHAGDERTPLHQLPADELLEKVRALLTGGDGGLPRLGSLPGVAATGRSLEQAHRAMQHALHSTTSYAAKTRRRLISNLRQAIDQSKSRAHASPGGPGRSCPVPGEQKEKP